MKADHQYSVTEGRSRAALRHHHAGLARCRTYTIANGDGIGTAQETQPAPASRSNTAAGPGD